MKSYVSAIFRSALAFGLVAVVSPSNVTFAQAGSKPAAKPGATAAVSRFSATATNLKRVNGETITIELTGWSSDAEREKILALLPKGPNGVMAALQQGAPEGKIWRSGSSFGMYVRYAVRIPEPDGTERIILVVDQDLSDWKAAFSGAPTDTSNPFTVIELRLTPNGMGEGKISVGAKITADATNKTLALENYTAAPMVFKGVKKEAGGDKASS